jgi:hypothetical protein
MYRLEIYRIYKNGDSVKEIVENNNLSEILFWYRKNWAVCVEKGIGYLHLYKDGNKLEFTKVKELGFYDRID